MIGKKLIDLTHDLPRDLVRLTTRRAQFAQNFRAAGFDKIPDAGAVVVVEIPLPALGFALFIDQDVQFPPHPAVMRLHEQFVFTTRPLFKILTVAKELVRFHPFNAHPRLLSKGRNLLLHIPIGGFHDPQGLDIEFPGMGNKGFLIIFFFRLQ